MDIREKIAQYLWEQSPDFKHGKPLLSDMAQGIQDNFLKQADYVLSIPRTKEGGECPKCKGAGRGQFYFNCNADCDDCNGSGQLPGITKSVQEVLEEWRKS